MATTLYGASDIAALFNVTKACASNWSKRYSDTPMPDYVTTDGRKFWLTLDAWKDWHSRRIEKSLDRAIARVDALRAQLAAAESTLNMRAGMGQ